MTTKTLRLTCFRLSEVSPHIPEVREDSIVVELIEANLETVLGNFSDDELVSELNRRHARAREIKQAFSKEASLFFQPANEDL